MNNPIHLSISIKGDSLYHVVSWKGLMQSLTNNNTSKREAALSNFILNLVVSYIWENCTLTNS